MLVQHRFIPPAARSEVPAVDQLHTMLLQELKTCRALLETSRKKTQALITGNTADILQQDQLILPLSQKAQKLADNRVEWIRAQGIESGTLPEFLLTLSGSRADELTYLRLELRRILMDIEAENHEHQALLSLSLRWIQQSIKAIGNAMNPQGATYSSPFGSSPYSHTIPAPPVNETAATYTKSNKPKTYAAIPLGGPIHTTDSVENAPRNAINRLPNGGLVPRPLEAYQLDLHP